LTLIEQEKRNPTLNRFEESVFCANRDYELVAFDCLSPEEQRVLSGLRKDPNLFGILKPSPRSNLGIKSVDRDVAQLYLRLQEPGKLPDDVKTSLGEECSQVVAKLVLDGVLMIEREGTFLTGPEAFEMIGEKTAFTTPPQIIAQLSLEALRYGQALALSDSIQLSNRLYFYNRIPLSPSWLRTFSSPEAVSDYLGIRAGKSTSIILDRCWSKVSLQPVKASWMMWESLSCFARPEKSGLTYKLYISPVCDYVKDAFQIAVEVFSHAQVPHFKIGKDAIDLLRPDKFIAYFWSLEALKEAADQLEQHLRGIPAQGVPFTAELAGNGLLSWGIDPPPDPQQLPWYGRESWRLWITNRLATALLAAKAIQMNGLEPWQFALERLRLENIDTDTWTPSRIDL
jgi:hypothetical protein